MDKNKPDYGNWVPQRLLIALWVFSAVTLAILIANLVCWKELAVTIVFAILFVILLAYSIAMQVMHYKFSFSGGNLMGKVHEHLLEKLSFDGEGKIIDIGCGSGALAIKCAKKYENATVTGLDYWGAVWDYAKEQCETNAKIENVSNIEFVKGDAAKICYDDETFDGAVSNFVFHEVRSVLDKRKLVVEALRVVKKGGSFAFHDIFESPRLYGNIDEFLQQLKDMGLEEVCYEPHTENLPFVPGIIKPMFRNMGLIYGKK